MTAIWLNAYFVILLIFFSIYILLTLDDSWHWVHLLRIVLTSLFVNGWCSDAHQYIFTLWNTPEWLRCPSIDDYSHFKHKPTPDYLCALCSNNSSNIISRVARMPVERYASEYNMKHGKRGMAIIFNHEHFEVMSLKARAGTNVDCENLRNTLDRLHFDVTVLKDLRFSDIQHHIEQCKFARAASMNAHNLSLHPFESILSPWPKFFTFWWFSVSRADHSDHDCILIAILSHGELGYIYAKDTHYKLESIWSYFTASRCPSLAGKPKLFFIQACQGDRLDGGVTLHNRTETDSADSQTMAYKIPVHADFLIAYSTIPGKWNVQNREHNYEWCCWYRFTPFQATTLGAIQPEDRGSCSACARSWSRMARNTTF